MAQVFTASKRLAAVTAVGVLLAGAALVVGAPAAAASTHVDCSTTNLQSVINNAAPGATLIVTGTCAGNFTIDKNLTLLGQGTAVLDGQLSGTTLGVPQGASVVLARLRITGGAPVLPDLFHGVGIDNAGTLTLNDSTVSGNAIPGVGGGGIDNSGTLTLNDSAVSDNSFGDGINNSGTVTLRHSTVSDNGGGGIATGSFENGATTAVALYDSTVSDNRGGGIYQDTATAHSGTVTLHHSTVSHNTNEGLGGGISNEQGTVTLRDSTVSGNTTSTGGGISNGGTVTLYDSTISGNSVDGVGGGIDNAGTVTLNNSTVTGNTAGAGGGGIFTNSVLTVTLRGSTVSGNNPDNCEPLGSVAGCTG